MSQDVIKLYIGADPNNCDLEQMMVADYSLNKHSSLPIDITWLRLSRAHTSPFYGWRTETWTTSFSGLRWAAPALAGGHGRAIYLDPDTIALADIAELWRIPFQPGKIIIAKGGTGWRYCVSVFDCRAVSELLGPMDVFKANPNSHRDTIKYFLTHPALVQEFPMGKQWNYCDNENLEQINDPSVKIVHYTAIDTQPSARYAIPRLAAEGRKHWYNGPVNEHPRREITALFDRYYEEALAAGYSIEKYRRVPFGEFKKADLSGYSGAKERSPTA